MSLNIWRRRRDTGPSEATRARIQAERELERTRAETPWYRALAERHREIQRINHLGLNAVRAIRGDDR